MPPAARNGPEKGQENGREAHPEGTSGSRQYGGPRQDRRDDPLLTGFVAAGPNQREYRGDDELGLLFAELCRLLAAEIARETAGGPPTMLSGMGDARVATTTSVLNELRSAACFALVDAKGEDPMAIASRLAPCPGMRVADLFLAPLTGTFADMAGLVADREAVARLSGAMTKAGFVVPGSEVAIAPFLIDPLALVRAHPCDIRRLCRVMARHRGNMLHPEVHQMLAERLGAFDATRRMSPEAMPSGLKVDEDAGTCLLAGIRLKPDETDALDVMGGDLDASLPEKPSGEDIHEMVQKLDQMASAVESWCRDAAGIAAWRGFGCRFGAPASRWDRALDVVSTLHLFTALGRRVAPNGGLARFRGAEMHYGPAGVDMRFVLVTGGAPIGEASLPLEFVHGNSGDVSATMLDLFVPVRHASMEGLFMGWRLATRH